MGKGICVDLALLKTAAGSVDVIADAFRGADDLAESAQQACGHPLLARRLGQFADEWRVNRTRMTKQLEEFGELTHTAVDTYRDVDQQLAAALRGPS
jgi:hypothetical protein